MRKLPCVKVKNMTSDRSNRPVANQFIISTDKGTYFQSYNSIIVLEQNEKIYLDRNCWDYSVTTGKYRNRFLGETIKETKQKIKDGKMNIEDNKIFRKLIEKYDIAKRNVSSIGFDLKGIRCFEYVNGRKCPSEELTEFLKLFDCLYLSGDNTSILWRKRDKK